MAFVARPDLLRDRSALYARPDDQSGDGSSWRNRLLAYNEHPKGNPLALLPAHELYAHPVYGALVGRFGVKHVFILSAGWGLIPATFLTPDYDITFTSSADPSNRRRREDRYDDFCIIRNDGEEIVFLGGKDYLPLFCRLTMALKGRKTVFFNSADRPDLPAGFTARRYRTATRTNWHYMCAGDLAEGELHGL